MKNHSKLRNVYNYIDFYTSHSVQDEKLYSSVFYFTDVIASGKTLSISTINLDTVVKDIFKSISND